MKRTAEAIEKLKKNGDITRYDHHAGLAGAMGIPEHLRKKPQPDFTGRVTITIVAREDTGLVRARFRHRDANGNVTQFSYIYPTLEHALLAQVTRIGDLKKK